MIIVNWKLIIDLKQVFHLLIGFGHFPMLNNIMLQKLTLQFGKHLILNIHKITLFNAMEVG